MEIRINNYPVEITLGNEKNAKDAVASVTEWVNHKNLIFVGVDIDGTQYHLDDVPDISMDNIKVMDCLVQSKSDVVYEAVNEGIVYCSRVAEFLNNLGDDPIDTDELEDLVSGMEWLHEVFQTVSSILRMNLDEIKFRDGMVSDYLHKLDEVKHRVTGFLANMDEEGEIELDEFIFHQLREIFAIFLVSEEMRRLVIDSIDSPDVLVNSLRDIRDNLGGQRTNLEEAASLYQTGRDSEGNEKLFKFIEFMFTYTRTCYQISPVFNIDLREVVIDGISLDEKNRELQMLLNETVDIMENNDMISLADILEYEIKETIENLEKYIELLLQKIAD